MTAGIPGGLRLDPPGEVVAWQGERPIDRNSLRADAARLAAQMPGGVRIVNDCRDRYRFLVTFVAALLRENSLVLRGDRSTGTLAALARSRSDLLRVTDSEEAADPGGPPTLVCASDGTLSTNGTTKVPIPPIRPDAVVARVYTSGSTGAPSANDKTWATLHAKACLFRDYLESPPDTAIGIVATVPPQHMYGLECSVLTPLTTAASVHASRPLLPPAIAAALATVPTPRVLVTTPLHLNALLVSHCSLPPLDAIVSATASLSRELAAAAESRYHTRVVEIYGFTEAGIVANRRTARTEIWTCRNDIAIRACEDGFVAEASHLPTPVPLTDVIELHSAHSFRLLGRGTDLVNIAGKRASLAGLNTILLAIEGVHDGFFALPPEIEGSRAERLSAVVVAPGLTPDELRKRLRQHIDPVFLPRRIRFVELIPRNETGKVTRETVENLLRSQVEMHP